MRRRMLPAKVSSLPVPKDKNPATVYLSSLAAIGRRGMASRLKGISDLMALGDPRQVAWEDLRFQHVAAIRTKLVESGQAPATVNLSLSALRGIARASFNLGYIGADDLQRILSVKNVRGERLPRGRALSHGELRELVKVCDARDLALLATCYIGGLRRAEVVSLDVVDYNQETGELKVRGKGGKERIVYLTNSGAEAMKRWLDVRGMEPGPLFLHVNKGGNIGSMKRLTTQAVYSAMKRRAKEAGIANFSPHDLRRSFISDLLDAGADITTVSKLAGHASVTTTARYDRRGEEAKRKVAGLLHLPL